MLGHYNKNRGFSLLEILVALVILAGGLLTLAHFQATITTNEGYNKQRVQAAHLSQLIVDKMRIRAAQLLITDPATSLAQLRADLQTFTTSLTTTMNGDAATENSVLRVLTPNTTYTTQVSYPNGTLSSAITDVAIPVQITVSWSDTANNKCSSGGNATECSATFKTLISRESQLMR
jgi:prepilin-type N-terminal cleavage/methylation domain-containing protein